MSNSGTKERSTAPGSQIIQVHFLDPVDGRMDYFFGSLKAVFATFSEEQIGCTLSRVYSSHLGKGEACVTTKCRITRESVTRFPQAQGRE